MKIAMTHKDLPNQSKGGVAKQAHTLANVLTKRGHEVTMFTFSPWYDDCSYKIHQYDAPSKVGPFKAFQLAYLLARTDFSEFDIIHTHGDNYLLSGRHPQLRTFHGSAIDEAISAVTFRRRMWQRFVSLLETAGARAADRNVGVSEATRFRIPAVTQVIPCGVDLNQFQPGPKSENPSILFVGTTGGRKRGSLLADVFVREIRTKYPDAELWSVAEADMPGEGIVNLGRVNETKLAELFQRAWVFCMPSSYEGFGVPYIEAMASGTVAVSTPNPGGIEVLGNGKFGIVSPDDRLGEYINRLLGDRSERAKYEQIGLKRSQEFAWSQVAASYETVYRELIEEFSPVKLEARETRALKEGP